MEHHLTLTLQDNPPVCEVPDVDAEYVELDEERNCITIFNSPLGLYWFFRMPFGFKMPWSVFQAKIDQTFEGGKGMIRFFDDTVVYGSSKEENLLARNDNN